jgi:hypothetical protein
MRAKRLARSIASFATAGAVISVVAVPDAVARSSYPYCAIGRLKTSLNFLPPALQSEG